MTEDIAPIVADTSRPGLGDLFSRLIKEGEAFIRAEVRLYRAQATRKAFSAGVVVAMIGGALMLTQALVVAILIGVILTIAPLVGIGWAVLIVAAVTLIVIGVMALVGRKRISKLLKFEE